MSISPFERAAEVFAPQKGADARTRSSACASRLERMAETLPRDPRALPMGGGRGRLSGGLWARFGARVVPGASWILDAIGFDRRLSRAPRGCHRGGPPGREHAPRQGGQSRSLQRCARAGVPLHALVGSSTLGRGRVRSELGLASLDVASSLADLEAAGAALAARAGEQ